MNVSRLISKCLCPGFTQPAEQGNPYPMVTVKVDEVLWVFTRTGLLRILPWRSALFWPSHQLDFSYMRWEECYKMRCGAAYTIGKMKLETETKPSGFSSAKLWTTRYWPSCSLLWTDGEKALEQTDMSVPLSVQRETSLHQEILLLRGWWKQCEHKGPDWHLHNYFFNKRPDILHLLFGSEPILMLIW